MEYLIDLARLSALDPKKHIKHFSVYNVIKYKKFWKKKK